MTGKTVDLVKKLNEVPSITSVLTFNYSISQLILLLRLVQNKKIPEMEIYQKSIIFEPVSNKQIANFILNLANSKKS